MNDQLDSNQKAITEKIRALVPDVTAIIFHGSRVHGLPSPTSDYDILVLTPRGVNPVERKRIKGRLQKSLPHTRLDIAFGSERWMRTSLNREAHLRFWLENGIATYGTMPRVKEYPPLYKDVTGTELDMMQANHILVRGWGRTIAYKAQAYLRTLKHLTLIELAIRQEYRNETLWNSVQQQVGEPLFEILRNDSKRYRLRKSMVNRLERIVSRKFRQLRRELAESELPSLLAPRQEA